jgi:phosphohistidine phosphatase
MKNDPELKRLYIVRHGKSSWDFPGIDDIDRPLIERGISSSYRMSRAFFGKNPLPDLIITSPAIRALHTALIFARTLELPTSLIKIEQSIYMTSESDLLECICSFDDSLNAVMVFGHNPCLTDFANRFLKDKLDNIPTSGMVTLIFRTKLWKDINPGNLIKEDFEYPKKLN